MVGRSSRRGLTCEEAYDVLLADFGDKLVGLSPWHVKDHVLFGTWAKLNAACKRVLKTDSIQTFASAFGYCFEEACADIAREAAGSSQFRDHLILPSQPGADDEIEDVVLVDEDVVALLSAKASLVPEASLRPPTATAMLFAGSEVFLRGAA